MFQGCRAFNRNIGVWDMSSATNLQALFDLATSFKGDITAWNVAKVTDFSFMFARNPNFNQDITRWDTSSAIDMSWMFYGGTEFNQNIGAWKVSNVPTSMPTNAPSFSPTAVPTNEPSEVPTPQPTTLPTLKPTRPGCFTKCHGPLGFNNGYVMHFTLYSGICYDGCYRNPEQLLKLTGFGCNRCPSQPPFANNKNPSG